MAVRHVGQEEWQGQVETQASESNGHTDLADDTIGEESWVVESGKWPVPDPRP